MEHPERKGIWGFWFSEADAQAIAIYAEQVEAVRSKWGK